MFWVDQSDSGSAFSSLAVVARALRLALKLRDDGSVDWLANVWQ